MARRGSRRRLPRCRPIRRSCGTCCRSTTPRSAQWVDRRAAIGDEHGFGQWVVELPGEARLHRRRRAQPMCDGRCRSRRRSRPPGAWPAPIGARAMPSKRRAPRSTTASAGSASTRSSPSPCRPTGVTAGHGAARHDAATRPRISTTPAAPRAIRCAATCSTGCAERSGDDLSRPPRRDRVEPRAPLSGLERFAADRSAASRRPRRSAGACARCPRRAAPRSSPARSAGRGAPPRSSPRAWATPRRCASTSGCARSRSARGTGSTAARSAPRMGAALRRVRMVFPHPGRRDL